MFAWLQTRGSASHFLPSSVKVERTYDVGTIRYCVLASWSATRSDDIGEPENWQPNMHESMVYLRCITNHGEIVGLFTLVPRTTVSYEIHVNMLPAAYGKFATEAMKRAFEWAWENTKAERIIGEVPENNKLALNYAKRCGMRPCGFQPHSWKRDGKLYAMICFGISRPGVR